jgi:hypothetical protein
MRSVVIAGLFAAFVHSQAPAPSALRIVVLEGEGAVNIIQQKTAVRPLVEVRDRNNVPVAGATVTFAISGGQPAAFAGGLQTLTVTTNAAGQAAAGGLNALGSGAFQIQVQAAYQGQIATAAISQTNFATAAAAAQAGTAAGAGGTGGSTTGAAGGAAGGGGGVSGTTLGIVGAVVAGGAVAATQVVGGDEGGDSVSTAGSSAKTYSAEFSGPVTVTFSNSGGGACVQQRAVSGSLKLTFDSTKNTALYNVNAPTSSSNTNIAVCPQGGLNPGIGGETAIASPANPSFTVTNPAAGGTSLQVSITIAFTGTQSGDTITGTLTYTETMSGFASGGGTISFPVTLR